MGHAHILPATPQQTALIAHLHSLDRRKLERTIEALIAICDIIDGDIDAEPGAWHEDINMRRRKGDALEDVAVEDGREGFDPEEDMCLAGDDRVTSGSVLGSNSLQDDGAGDAEDAEFNGPPSLCDLEIQP